MTERGSVQRIEGARRVFGLETCNCYYYSYYKERGFVAWSAGLRAQLQGGQQGEDPVGAAGSVRAAAVSHGVGGRDTVYRSASHQGRRH